MKKFCLGLLLLFVTSLSGEPVTAQQAINLRLNTLPAHPNAELVEVGS